MDSLRRYKIIKNKWSLKYRNCISCHSTEARHESNGLCARCYYAEYRKSKKELIRTWTQRYLEKHKNNSTWIQRTRANALKCYYKNKAAHLKRAYLWRQKNKEWTDKYKVEHAGCTPRKRPLLYWQNRFQLLYVLKLGCTKCGSKHNLHAHHIIPEKAGGSHNINNLEILCKKHHIDTGLHRNINRRGD